MNDRLYQFVGGDTGPWTVIQSATIVGPCWPEVSSVDILHAGGRPVETAKGATWVLRGVTSNSRYATRSETSALRRAQEGIGRPDATLAALLPIRKNPAWWALSQDERREVFEESSHHTAIGLRYLPAIARRLHHCRDLASSEPFDFLTYFEFREADASQFDELVAALRATPEWAYVDYEVDIRLARS